MEKGLKFVFNLIVLVAGILLIAISRNAQAVKSIIFFTGVVFVIPAVINMMVLIRENKSKDGDKQQSATARWAGWLTCGGALTLGLVMCFFPDSFHSLFIYIFGLALAFGGFYHFYMIFRGLRPVKFPGWLAVMPGLMLVGALLLFILGEFHRPDGQSGAILVTGIGCVLFAMTTTIEYFTCRAYERAARDIAQRAGNAAPVADPSRRIEDVEGHEA